MMDESRYIELKQNWISLFDEMIFTTFVLNETDENFIFEWSEAKEKLIDYFAMSGTQSERNPFAVENIGILVFA